MGQVIEFPEYLPIGIARRRDVFREETAVIILLPTVKVERGPGPPSSPSSPSSPAFRGAAEPAAPATLFLDPVEFLKP